MENFVTIIDKIIELFESTDGIFSSADGFLSGIQEVFASVGGAFTDIGGAFTAIGVAIASITGVIVALILLINLIVSVVTSVVGALGTAGVAIISFAVTLVGIIISAVCLLAKYLLLAIPTFKVARNAKCKQAWLAWLPICQTLACTFVLSRISGKEEFELFGGKIKIKQGLFVFLGYILLYFFADAIILLLLLVLSALPVIGYIFSGTVGLLLFYVPEIIMGIIEYVYLRDTLDTFKANKKKNCVHALVVTVIDCFITSGYVRHIYLITMMRSKPIIVSPTEEAQESEAVSPVLAE